jgi:hypothetical protein
VLAVAAHRAYQTPPMRHPHARDGGVPDDDGAVPLPLPVHGPDRGLVRLCWLGYVESILLRATPEDWLTVLVCPSRVACAGMSDGEYISLGWHEREDLGAVIAYLR